MSLACEPVSWENLLQPHRQGSGQTLHDGVRDKKAAMSEREGREEDVVGHLASKVA